LIAKTKNSKKLSTFLYSRQKITPKGLLRRIIYAGGLFPRVIKEDYAQGDKGG